MKLRIFSLLLIVFVVTGCTAFKVKTPEYKASYLTLFEDKDIDSLEVKKNSKGLVSIVLTKYSKKVNPDSIEATAGGVGNVAGTALRAAATL